MVTGAEHDVPRPATKVARLNTEKKERRSKRRIVSRANAERSGELEGLSCSLLLVLLSPISSLYIPLSKLRRVSQFTAHQIGLRRAYLALGRPSLPTSDKRSRRCHVVNAAPATVCLGAIAGGISSIRQARRHQGCFC